MKQTLEEAIVGFEGTVILVSHDRRFLETTTKRIVSVRDGVVDIFPAGFRDYAAAAHPRRSEAPPATQAVKDRPEDDARRRRAFEDQKNRARATERSKKRISELEKMIANGEAELMKIRAALREDPGGDWAKLAERAKEEQALTKRVDALMSEWAKLSEGS